MEKYDENIDYESYLSDDCLHDFLKTIKKYKAATSGENEEMFRAYHEGDTSIKDLIIKKNIALVVSMVSRTYKRITSDEKLEYIQNGIIGLMEAVDTYDLSRGTTFSTHAEYSIQMRINHYRYRNERLIRRPDYIEVRVGRYKRLVHECEKENKPLPSRQEICSIIDANESTLKRIEEDYKLDAISLDAPVEQDGEDVDDLINAIGEESKSFNDILDKVVMEEILKTIKINLTRHEYFIFYYRILNRHSKTLKEIGSYFNVTREAIRLTETKVIEKIKKMFNDDHTLKRKYIDQVKMQYPFESIKVTPCPIEDNVLYFFLRDEFSEKDQIILKELLLSDLFFDSNRIALELEESKEYVDKRKKAIEEIITKSRVNIRFKLFYNNVIDKYQSRVFYLDLDSDLSDCFDIKKNISDYWQDKTVNDVFDLATQNNISLTEQQKEKINHFFGIAPKKEVSFPKDRIERDVNYCLYGFAIHDIPTSKLYPFFLENQDKFTSTQIAYLNKFYFKKEKATSNEANLYFNNVQTIVDKLVLLYYNVEDYRNDNFTREKYLSVRSKCLEEIDKRGIKLLDLYYGVKSERKNVPEIAEYLHEDESIVEDDFRRSKNNAITIYLGTTQYTFDKNIYAPILEDENLNLGYPHYDVAKLFFLEDKTYQQIADTFDIDPKLTPRKVADLVKYACSFMDNYRFGINSTEKKYSKEFLLEVLDSSDYDARTKEIIRTFIDNKNTLLTAEICHEKHDKVCYLGRRLNKLADLKSIEEVEITKDDVEATVMEHESTNVLTERERKVLSMFYGLKNIYNPSGKKKYPIDIAEILGIKNNVLLAIKTAQEHVAAHKIGLLKNPLDFIDRKELEEALRNPRIPISEMDRDIIINAYGLYDTQFFTRQEIGEKYGLREPVVRQRLYKAFITIKKYQNQEIDGEVLFSVDVEPYLKYFILEDREILTLLYRDKVSQREIEKRFGFTTHQFRIYHQKIRMHLDDLRKNIATGIDFDFFWNNARNKDVPFYGNQDLAVEICFLYYEKRLPKADIIRLYYPQLGKTTVSDLIREYTVAMLKYQHGFRKANEFSPLEVANYYEEHKDTFWAIDHKRYRIFFDKIKRNGPFAKVRPNKYITYDLIKEKYPDYFRLDNTTPEQVKDILGKCGHIIPKEDVQILTSLFGVTHANLLSDEDWEEVINILGSLQLKNEQAKKVTNDNDEGIDQPKSKKLIS